MHGPCLQRMEWRCRANREIAVEVATDRPQRSCMRIERNRQEDDSRRGFGIYRVLLDWRHACFGIQGERPLRGGSCTPGTDDRLQTCPA